jgi:hypothetical protein
MGKQFKIQVSWMLCRSCSWIMEIALDKWFTCTNAKCEEFGKFFQVITSVSEIPMDQAIGDSIPGVNEEEHGS